MKHIKLQVSTLSPIHIATGDALRPGDYLIHDKKLFEFGRWGLSRALNESQRKELLNILNSDKQDLPVQVQRFLGREAAGLAAAAERMRPLLPGIVDYYENRIGQTMQAGDHGKPGTHNKLELMRHIGAELATPYIPGSTIKGTLRGLLLDLLNKGQAPSKPLNANVEMRELRSDEQEKRVLGYSKIPDDPFQGLLVGDASATSASSLELDYWLVNRLRLAPKAGKEQNTGLLIAPVECLAPLQSAALQLDLRVKPEYIHHPQIEAWLKDFATFASQINSLTLPQFVQELEWMQHNNVGTRYAYAPQQNWLATMQALLQDPAFRQQLQQGQAMLLRVGKYAGAINKTIRGWRHIKRMAGKGQKPTYHPDVMTKCLALPREKSPEQGLPFGWILLQPEGTPLIQNALLAPLQEPHSLQLATVRANWLQQRQDHLQALALHQQQMATRAAEKAAQQAQEEQQRAIRASLSPQALAMLELDEALAEAKRFNIKDPAGPLRQQLNQCVAQVAENGNEQDKARLKEIFSAILNHWGADRKKNAKLKELWGKLG